MPEPIERDGRSVNSTSNSSSPLASSVAAGLMRKGPSLYDPAVTDGKILVGVQNPPASNLPALERALMAGGAGELKRS